MMCKINEDKDDSILAFNKLSVAFCHACECSVISSTLSFLDRGIGTSITKQYILAI